MFLVRSVLEPSALRNLLETHIPFLAKRPADAKEYAKPPRGNTPKCLLFFGRIVRVEYRSEAECHFKHISSNLVFRIYLMAM